MRKLLLLFMVLLSVCSSAFAESVDDVLKDCKLDRNRWKIVEWFKTDKFVRLYDSASVSVTGPGQFDAVIYDYYYGNSCISDSCKLRGSKHYHTEKWGFNSNESIGTLRSFALKDADDNTVDSYDYPSNNQIATGLERKGIEEKTMLKIKASLKGNKTFAAEAPKTDKQKTEDRYGRFAPLPQPIGSTDGEWTYLGRFTGPSNLTYLENILKMTPFDGNTAHDGVLDVYYHHTHDRCGYHENSYNYGCILKFIPLDMNGNRLQRRGFYTELVDIVGGTKGAFVGTVKSVRRYDTETHQLVETFERDGYKDNVLNPVTSYGFKGAEFTGSDHPFSRAFYDSKCPGDELWKRK